MERQLSKKLTTVSQDQGREEEAEMLREPSGPCRAPRELYIVRSKCEAHFYAFMVKPEQIREAPPESNEV